MDAEKYNLEYIHDIDWRDIFAVWRVGEAYQKSWEAHWTERGFQSWDEWRKNYAEPLNPEKKKWKVYKIKNIADIKNFYGTPTRGWIKKCYAGEITKKIGEILDHPVVKDNEKVSAVINNFPHSAMLTGIINNGNIVLVEGMHRALALAKMSKSKMDFQGNVVIALAEHDEDISKLGKGGLENN